MAGNKAQILRGASKYLGNALGYIPMGRAVETISTHAVLFHPLIRDAVNVSPFRDSGMEAGLEDGHHWDSRQDFPEDLHRLDVNGVVHRGDCREFLHRGQQIICDRKTPAIS